MSLAPPLFPTPPALGAAQADPASACACCELEETAFCAGLSSQGLSSLLAIRGNIRADVHETIFREGDSADHVFSVVNGAVKLSKLMSDGRRQIIGFLFSGDFFGFSPIATYGYTAEAISGTTLCRFSESRLRTVLEKNSELERRLRRVLVQELSFAQEQMLLLGRMTAREKVAHFLLMLSRRAQARGETGATVPVPMSRLDMADYLGLTIETVSRTLTAMKKEGLIALPTAALVELLAPEVLRAVADGRSG